MIKVILPAQEIPNETVVTKHTGEKQYILKGSVNLSNNRAGDASTSIKGHDY